MLMRKIAGGISRYIFKAKPDHGPAVIRLLEGENGLVGLTSLTVESKCVPAREPDACHMVDSRRAFHVSPY